MENVGKMNCVIAFLEILFSYTATNGSYYAVFLTKLTTAL